LQWRQISADFLKNFLSNYINDEKKTWANLKQLPHRPSCRSWPVYMSLAVKVCAPWFCNVANGKRPFAETVYIVDDEF